MKNLCGALVSLMVVILLNSCKVPEPEPTNYPSAKNFPGGKLSAVKTGTSDKYDQVQRHVYQGNRLVTVNGYYVKKTASKSPQEVLDYSANLVYDLSEKLIEIKYSYKGWDFSSGYQTRTSRFVMTYGANSKIETVTEYMTDGDEELSNKNNVIVTVFTYNASQQLVQQDRHWGFVTRTNIMKYNPAGDMVQSVVYSNGGIVQTDQYDYGDDYNFLGKQSVLYLPFVIYSDVVEPDFKKNLIKITSKSGIGSSSVLKRIYTYDSKGRVIKQKLVTEDESQTYGFTQYEYEG